ncbi:MAG: hypothetical protein ABIO17_07535 [Pseudoxanthomonas sp.]
MAEDYSYLGSGMIHFREYQALAPFIEAGNCSALTFSPQVNGLELQNFTLPGGGLQNEVSRMSGVEMAYTFHDFSPDNIARGLRGTATDIVAGTATEEPVVAYKGGFTPLAKIPAAITLVEPAGGGVAYVAGTDYEFRNGGIFIPATSTILNPIAGAANIDVTYTYALQTKVEALINSAKQYEVLFTGLNEARSGKAVRIRAHKVSGGVLASFAAIGEEYGAGEVTGKLLLDGSKVGDTISKYFTVEIVK